MDISRVYSIMFLSGAAVKTKKKISNMVSTEIFEFEVSS